MEEKTDLQERDTAHPLFEPGETSSHSVSWDLGKVRRVLWSLLPDSPGLPEDSAGAWRGEAHQVQLQTVFPRISPSSLGSLTGCGRDHGCGRGRGMGEDENSLRPSQGAKVGKLSKKSCLKPTTKIFHKHPAFLSSAGYTQPFSL